MPYLRVRVPLTLSTSTADVEHEHEYEYEYERKPKKLNIKYERVAAHYAVVDTRFSKGLLGPFARLFKR